MNDTTKIIKSRDIQVELMAMAQALIDEANTSPLKDAALNLLVKIAASAHDVHPGEVIK